MKFASFLRGLDDGFDAVRLCGVGLVMAYIIQSGVAVWINRQAFDWQSFGIGGAALLAAFGAGAGAKDYGVAKAYQARKS